MQFALVSIFPSIFCSVSIMGPHLVHGVVLQVARLGDLSATSVDEEHVSRRGIRSVHGQPATLKWTELCTGHWALLYLRRKADGVELDAGLEFRDELRMGLTLVQLVDERRYLKTNN